MVAVGADFVEVFAWLGAKVPSRRVEMIEVDQFAVMESGKFLRKWLVQEHDI